MITVRNISKTLKQRPILQNVTFTVPDASVTGLVGPNGAGKSTLMRCMLSLTQADTGTARFNGVAYKSMSMPFRQVGSLLDTRSLIPSLRVGELLTYCARSQNVQQRTGELLDLVGLAGMQHERVPRLSLGMQQRLGIATALIASPRYLLLDEPLNGLDPAGIAWLRGLLNELRSTGCTILLSSHIMSELALIADDIVMMSNGRVVLNGPLADLQTENRNVVQARTAHPKQLLAAIKEQCGNGQHTSGNQVTITGLNSREVFAIAARCGIALDELNTYQRTH